jgi:hypothetical protein
MKSLDDHFEGYPCVGEHLLSEENEHPAYEVESSCEEDCEYLSGAHSQMAGCYSDHRDYDHWDDMPEIWVSSKEEPDPGELAAFWQEEEVSL